MADDPFSASPTATKKRNTRPQAEKTTTAALSRRNNRLDNRERDEAAAPITPESVEQTDKREK
jgi:hypothetical protein